MTTQIPQESGQSRQLQPIEAPRYSARLKTLFENLEAGETTELWAYSNIDILFFPNKNEAWLAAAYDLKRYQVETPLEAVEAYLTGGLKPNNGETYNNDDIFILTDKGRQALDAQ